MHIADGICSPTVIAAGYAAGGLGVAYGFRRMDADRVPQTAVMAAGFFVASLIHIPIPPGSVHLLLPGLMGLVLGWTAFPAVFVALLLQFVFFSHGGITTIGVNTVNMALPAVACSYMFGRATRRARGRNVFAAGFAAGALGVIFASLLYVLMIGATSQSLLPLALTVAACHFPLAILEGLVTGAAVAYLRQVRPEVLELDATAPVRA